MKQMDFMNKSLWFLVLICLPVICPAQDFNPFAGPQPIAVLVQADPWLMVIGSDTPMLAVYDNGEVIYAQTDQKHAVYVHKLLTMSELQEIKNKLTSFGDYSSVKRHYNLMPNVTDLRETMIYLSTTGKPLVTSIYGLYELKTSGTQLHGHTEFHGKQKSENPPEALVKLYEYLVSLKFTDAKPWEPKYLEVMIWDYSYAPDSSIHWPKDWPGPNSPQTMKHGDLYSIFLPGSENQRLTNFLKTEKEKGAVEIGGKKWAVSFRYVFPSEPVWAAAFRK